MLANLVSVHSLISSYTLHTVCTDLSLKYFDFTAEVNGYIKVLPEVLPIGHRFIKAIINFILGR